MENEAKARIKINRLLEESGWRFESSSSHRKNVLLEEKTNWDDDEGKTQIGFIDYLLVNEKDFPLCIIEAKNISIDPLTGKEQARKYAKATDCPFVILSNGDSHYLWDVKNAEPRQIPEFPTQQSLQERANYNPIPQELNEIEVTKDFLESRELRDYQIAAIHAVQKAAQKGKTRFLLEMATGTGKTTIAAALCELFLRSGQAERILFLVDRIELENQAKKNFDEIFVNTRSVRKYKGGNWREGQIVISTVQSLLSNNKYRDFRSGDFDLIISDESHRTIGGKSRAVFEYFVGYKIGLTATPKDFIKGLQSKTISQAEWEDRNMRDTYQTFDCEDGTPTYLYNLNDGIQAGILIKPVVYQGYSNITKDLLSDGGYAMPIDTSGDNDDGDEVAFYKAKDFERTYFNPNTNRILCKAIIDNAIKDPITNEVGKTLVFCVSRNHAARITQILNTFAREVLQYNTESTFAVQITSDIADAQKFAKDFTNNELCGTSNYGKETYPEYRTSKARICVTVGMMTTGYDCPDLLNIALLRPIFSPSEFIQMKGRGTRPHTFSCQEPNRKEKKDKYLILDFFDTHTYFEEGFQYDKAIPLPDPNRNDDPATSGEGEESDGGHPPAIERPNAVIDKSPDELHSESIIYIGDEGMKVDRLMSQNHRKLFEHIIRNSKTIQELHENEGLDSVLEFIKVHVLNYESGLTAEALRRSYTDEYSPERKISLKEMVMMALNIIDQFKTRTQRVDEEFDRFCDIQKPKFSEEQQEAIHLKRFFETYLSDSDFRDIIDRNAYAELDGYHTYSMSELRQIKDFIEQTTKYINEYLIMEIAEFDWRYDSA